MHRLLLTLTLMAAPAATASAQPAPGAVARDELAGATFHAGVDVRFDLGTHQLRVPIGVRSCAWDATLVMDPLFYLLDGEHDLDLFVERLFAGGKFGVLFGWRWSAIAVADGFHHQQRTLVGFTAALPSVASGQIRSRLSMELATLWVKYGGGTSTDWISADRNLIDHFALGLFLRIEYAKVL